MKCNITETRSSMITGCMHACRLCHLDLRCVFRGTLKPTEVRVTGLLTDVRLSALWTELSPASVAILPTLLYLW